MTYHKTPIANLFSTRSEEDHARFKRQVSSAYSMTSLLTLERYVDSCSELFFARLDELFVNPRQSCDLGKWLQLYAMDVVAEVTFGQRFGCLAEGGDVSGMMDLIRVFLIYASVIGQVPYLHKILLGNPALPYIFPQIDKTNHVSNVQAPFLLSGPFSDCFFSLPWPGLQRERPIQRNTETLFGNSLKTKRRANLIWSTSSAIAPVTCKIADDLSCNLLTIPSFAGSDTTAIALRSAIDGLLTHPECYRKLQAEIDQRRTNGNLSLPVKYSEAQQMPYLQAVLKEAMRYHPSTGFIMERHVPKGGATICGVEIPGGTIVGINSWVVHRHKAVFGEDADEFRPERWLDADEERLKSMERSFFVVCLPLSMTLKDALLIYCSLELDRAPAQDGMSVLWRCQR